MAIKDLSTQIDSFIIRTEARLEAVVKQAISDTVEEMQTPREKGGRMPVKTGFLRSSGVASLNAAPTGPARGDPKGKYVWTGESLNAVLAKMKIGDAFYFGWSAVYARTQEARAGFLEMSLMNWQNNIDKAVSFFRKKDGI